MMRSPQQMLELILSTAHQDERIRAVVMNGSRANPAEKPDIFQDFDIVYFVTDPTPLTRNLEWIERFGEMMILQLPDDMSDPPPDDPLGYTYLMQFTDGNRIDLCIFPLDQLDRLPPDSQTVVLLDKDGILPAFEPPSERDYLPKPPTQKQFGDCCNEYWWVNPYVAKGLWRGQILYAHYMLDAIIRPQLVKMLVWYMGIHTQFQVNPGKFGKYYQDYLEPELWERLMQTYSDAGYEHTWQALFAMGDLFRMTAQAVAANFGYTYPAEDDQRVAAHLRHVHALPHDAASIY